MKSEELFKLLFWCSVGYFSTKFAFYSLIYLFKDYKKVSGGFVPKESQNSEIVREFLLSLAPLIEYKDYEKVFDLLQIVDIRELQPLENSLLSYFKEKKECESKTQGYSLSQKMYKEGLISTEEYHLAMIIYEKEREYMEIKKMMLSETEENLLNLYQFLINTI